MGSSSASEPSHTPEREAGGATEEELIADERGCVGSRRRKKRRQESGGEVCVQCRPAPPRLFIALRAEEPRGRAWD